MTFQLLTLKETKYKIYLNKLFTGNLYENTICLGLRFSDKLFKIINLQFPL